MTTTNRTLVHVEVDGTQTEIGMGYEALKDALNDRPFDFVRANARVGCYIDDEGMLLGLALNVPVSMLLGRAIYGPAVVCHGDPDAEGDTLPLDDHVREMLMVHCMGWRLVVATAQAVGQDPYARANEATIPPPTIIEIPDGMSFDEALRAHVTLDEM